MPTFDASHSISKDLSKFGKAKIGACVSLNLRLSKASCCSFPHLNPTSFLKISFNGDAMVLKP